MAREELALQTQLLLQEASQLSQGARATDAEASALVEGDAPVVSELEAARQALLDKLKRKKEQRHAQLRQINQERYGFGGTSAPKAPKAATATTSAVGPRLTPVKAKAVFKPPVAASAGVTAHKKKDMLARLRKQAIQQGSQNMAKLFGYSSYEEQLKELNLIEKRKILESEKMMRESEAKEKNKGKEKGATLEEDEEEDEAAVDDGDDADSRLETSEPMALKVNTKPTPAANGDQTRDVSAGASSIGVDEVMTNRQPTAAASESESVRVKRRNRIDMDEDDGNEADSEQDGDADDDDDKMEVKDAADAATRSIVDASATNDASAKLTASPAPKKDRAAGFRELLRAEALENRRRKRLVKGGGANFVESEAEEDEEEDALKIGGLGDFGFGVPQAKTQESKEAEEERNALKLREDDLEGIVDDLSDDEQTQQQDLDEIFRKEAEEQDREQVKEVMRNVKEGFGRNRRAFSAGFQSGEARGRFNLDELVAADGSKFEAARLGLLESDEEWNEDEGGKKTKRSRRAGRGKDGEDGEGEDEDDVEEEDEEAEMERMLRERYKNQPQIYVTSSESEGEEEDTPGEATVDADADEVNSDEEREKQQMKLFSERARINRRMARMKDLQRQISLENGEEDGKKASEPVLPNLLLEEDEDSQELLKILNRTDVNTSASAAVSATAAPGSTKITHNEGKRGAARARPQPMLGRFNSFAGASSFNRVAGNCKLFNAGSGSGQSTKGFVFTSLGSERPEQDDAPATDEGELAPLAPQLELGKSKSRGQSARRPGKRGADAAAAGKSKKPKRASDFFSVLSSYQVVPSSSGSNHSAPL